MPGEQRETSERGDTGHSEFPAEGSATPQAGHWQVLGRVQGVGFRWFVRQQARRWGVRGWVRNLPDGSVEISAAGSAEAIEGLRAAVRRGPAGAEVAEVRDLPGDAEADLPDPFSILRG